MKQFRITFKSGTQEVVNTSVDLLDQFRSGRAELVCPEFYALTDDVTAVLDSILHLKNEVKFTNEQRQTMADLAVIRQQVKDKADADYDKLRIKV